MVKIFFFVHLCPPLTCLFLLGQVIRSNWSRYTDSDGKPRVSLFFQKPLDKNRVRTWKDVEVRLEWRIIWWQVTSLISEKLQRWQTTHTHWDKEREHMSYRHWLLSVQYLISKMVVTALVFRYLQDEKKIPFWLCNESFASFLSWSDDVFEESAT